MDPGRGRFLGMDAHLGIMARPATIHRFTYASIDPVLHIDPDGRESLISQITAIENQAKGIRAQISSGAPRQIIGSSFRNLGKMTEEAAVKLFQKCLKPPYAVGPRPTATTSEGARAVLDFTIMAGDRILRFVEIKYRLPRGASDAMSRLTRQLQAAVDSNNPVVLATFQPFATRGPTFRKILDKFGENKGLVTAASGFLDLAGVLSEFVVQGCVEEAMGRR